MQEGLNHLALKFPSSPAIQTSRLISFLSSVTNRSTQNPEDQMSAQHSSALLQETESLVFSSASDQDAIIAEFTEFENLDALPVPFGSESSFSENPEDQMSAQHSSALLQETESLLFRSASDQDAISAEFTEFENLDALRVPFGSESSMSENSEDQMSAQHSSALLQETGLLLFRSASDQDAITADFTEFEDPGALPAPFGSEGSMSGAQPRAPPESRRSLYRRESTAIQRENRRTDRPSGGAWSSSARCRHVEPTQLRLTRYHRQAPTAAQRL
jgi:hypothetical protein